MSISTSNSYGFSTLLAELMKYYMVDTYWCCWGLGWKIVGLLDYLQVNLIVSFDFKLVSVVVELVNPIWCILMLLRLWLRRSCYGWFTEVNLNVELDFWLQLTVFNLISWINNHVQHIDDVENWLRNCCFKLIIWRIGGYS